MGTWRTALAVLLFAALDVRGAESIQNVLPCGQVGDVGGLAAGTDLTRHTIDLARYPDAVCNDGTPAVFYYGAATTVADQGKWIIFLQGGGSCSGAENCAERWCSINTHFGMDKMTSSLTKPQIRGAGFLAPDARNRFRTWNRVLIHYCSSDLWGGTKANTLTFTTTAGASVEYAIQFRGALIVDAVLDTLRNAGTSTGKRRAASHGVDSVPVADASSSAWPDLDAATHVIFAGSSGGGNGVKNHADYVGAKLRATNPALADYRVVIDGSTPPLTEDFDYAGTTYCEDAPVGCTYEGYTRFVHDFVDVSLRGLRGDQSCEQYHSSREAGSEWVCGDREHVMFKHITSPMFFHQDLQDPVVGEGFVDTKLGTANDFALGVDSVLRNLPVPEEPRGATPGMFTLQCITHEAFTEDTGVFAIRVNGLNYNEVVWNWWSGGQPQQNLATYTGVPGKAPGCPED